MSLSPSKTFRSATSATTKRNVGEWPSRTAPTKTHTIAKRQLLIGRPCTPWPDVGRRSRWPTALEDPYQTDRTPASRPPRRDHKPQQWLVSSCGRSAPRYPTAPRLRRNGWRERPASSRATRGSSASAAGLERRRTCHSQTSGQSEDEPANLLCSRPLALPSLLDQVDIERLEVPHPASAVVERSCQFTS